MKPADLARPAKLLDESAVLADEGVELVQEPAPRRIAYVLSLLDGVACPAKRCRETTGARDQLEEAAHVGATGHVLSWTVRTRVGSRTLLASTAGRSAPVPGSVAACFVYRPARRAPAGP
eukprot:8265715-Heterocapsa_arctica.AAC.1